MLEMLRFKFLFGLCKNWKQIMVTGRYTLVNAVFLIFLIPCLEALASNQFTLKCDPKEHWSFSEGEYLDLDRDNFRISFDLDKEKFAVFGNYSGRDVPAHGHRIDDVGDETIWIRFIRDGDYKYVERVSRITGEYYRELMIGNLQAGYVKTFDCVKSTHYEPIPEMKTKF